MVCLGLEPGWQDGMCKQINWAIFEESVKYVSIKLKMKTYLLFGDHLKALKLFFVDSAILAQWSLTSPEIRSSNPVIENFYNNN